MTSGLLVSVIIPTFNRARIVGQAIQSVLQQHYRPVEIVVVDDGSTDDTERLAGTFGPSVRYVRQDNRGPSSARNHGARIAQGEILMFLDSDDVFLPGKLNRQVQLLQAAGPEVVCCVGSAILREENGRDHVSFDVARLRPRHREGLWTNPAQVLSTRFLVFNPVACVRRQAFAACGGFDESMGSHEDWDMELRLALMSPWAYTSEPLTVCAFRHRDSLTESNLRDVAALKASALGFQTRALASVCSQPNLDPCIELLLRAKVANTRRELSALRLSAALPALAGRWLLRADAALTTLKRRDRRSYPEMEVEPLHVVLSDPDLRTRDALERAPQ